MPTFSEFLDTAVTDNDWVCDLVTRPTDLFTLGCVGLILGTAVFSWLADAKGRRLAFYFSTLAMIVFQLIQIGVSQFYAAFLSMKVISSSSLIFFFLYHISFRSFPLPACYPCFKRR